MSFASVVNFNTRFLSREIPSDERIRELCDWCTRFNEEGLTPKLNRTGRSLGNLSFRLELGDLAFVITGSALASKDTLDASDLVTVHNWDQARKTVLASGVRDPSSESMMHYEIYRQRPDVNAIFHGHDPELTSHGPRAGLPQTEVARPPRTLESTREVLKILAQENFLIIKEHGFLSLGKDMEAAGRLALRMKREISMAKWDK